MLARPVRAALTTLGTVLGIATLVITLGVATTAGSQIVGRFDALTATSVTVTIPSRPPGQEGVLVDWSGVAAVQRLAGVRSVAALADSERTANMPVRSNDIVTPGGAPPRNLAVVAATTDLPAALRGRVSTGRFFDRGDIARRERVAVLGDQAARLLGVERVEGSPVIFIQGQAYTVIGVMDGLRREKRLSAAVILPPSTAAERFGLRDITQVVVNTVMGGAAQVARQAPIALAPGHANALSVTAPPDLSHARKAVTGDINGMFLALGLVSLFVGAVGIANVTLVTVMERVGEIGLRRALGASRRQIAQQFLLESVLIGGLGGVIGTSIGVLTVVSVAATRQWTPVIDLRLALGAPVAGAVTGLLAGLYPSLKAARMQPTESLRGPA
jgi:putative ABC transport system permease protein